MTTPDEIQFGIDQAIEHLLYQMAGFNPYDDEYAKMVDQLEKLHKIKSSYRDENQVSKETLITVGANLLGIVLILGYERAHVVTSKALSFVLKTRV